MDNLRGIVFMIIAMAGFAVDDLLIKILSASMPISQILIFTGLATAVAFLLVGIVSKTPMLLPELWSKPIILRTVADMFGGLFLVASISLMPLSAVSAILQATPLVVTLGGAFVFKEQVDWRRWLAIIIGFAGVLLILRPGSDTFQAASLMAVLGTLCLAIRDISTRVIRARIPTLAVSTYAFLSYAVGGLIATPFFAPFVAPTNVQWLLLAGVILTGGLSYNAIVLATRLGDMSVISPFRYTRLVFALILAMLVLNEQPPWTTLLGAAIILISGGYILWYENRRYRNAPKNIVIIE
jgi:drug/metabolite transporter (DMT)-like permease